MGCPVGLPSIRPTEFIKALVRHTLDEIAPIADVSRETVVICGSRSRPNVSRETISTEKIDEFETQCVQETRGDGIIG
jgi:hypothetical protein